MDIGCLYSVVVFLLVILLVGIAFLRDASLSQYIQIDNIISEIGLIFAIVSTEPVRKINDKNISTPPI